MPGDSGRATVLYRARGCPAADPLQKLPGRRRAAPFARKSIYGVGTAMSGPRFFYRKIERSEGRAEARVFGVRAMRSRTATAQSSNDSARLKQQNLPIFL